MTAICNRKMLRTFLAAVLVLCLALSLSVVSAFADDTEAADAAAGGELDTLSDETVSDGSEEDVSVTDTEAASEDASETESAADEETTTAAETKSEAQQKAETRRRINLIVGGVILVALVALAIVFRHKIPKWFKAVKSECGKIVWCPKDKLKKNSIVVVVIIVVIAVLIALLDIAFSTGIIELSEAIKNIGK
jgi:preprotein translocase SecE subunit